MGEVFFSLRVCIIRPVAFSSTKSCRKNVQVTRAADLQLDWPVFLLSCEICIKEWEGEGVMDVRERKC